MSHHPLPDLRTLGYRRTPQRQLVWDVLHRHGPYLTADEIYQIIQRQFPDFNLTTVYRNLTSMREMGLIQEVNTGKGPLRYVTAADHHGGPHFVCGTCGTVVEMNAPALSKQVNLAAKANGFIIDQNTDIVVYGRCSNCATLQTRQAAQSSL